MNTKNHKETTGRQKIEKHNVEPAITYRAIDWNRVENFPRTRLQREIQKKVTLPSAFDLAVKEEDARKLQGIIFKAIRYGGLAHSERQCVRLEFLGLSPRAISRELAVSPSAAKSYLKRGKEKILKYFQDKEWKSVADIKKSVLAD
ncbi:MAG: hypothetical protein HZC17_00115 [Candidatus Omnitrophica bacterium]|nr:hypothetical protein [Candidatus Omnitrophota bacterium]